MKIKIEFDLLASLTALFGTLAFLAACSSEPIDGRESTTINSGADESEDDKSAIDIGGRDAVRQCRDQDDFWLPNIISRIDQAVPNGTIGSSSYKEYFLQNDATAKGKEFVIRLTSEVGGESVKVMAIAPINNETCELGMMQARFGWNLYDAQFKTFLVP